MPELAPVTMTRLRFPSRVILGGWWKGGPSAWYGPLIPLPTPLQYLHIHHHPPPPTPHPLPQIWEGRCLGKPKPVSTTHFAAKGVLG